MWWLLPLLAVPAGLAMAETASFRPTLEQDSTRPGQDYHNFSVSSPIAPLCQMSCIADLQCRAWEYVPPGVQGASARCWLKNGVPPARAATGHVSGVVRPEGASAGTGTQSLQMIVRSRSSDRCLDVPRQRVAAGAPLQLWPCDTPSPSRQVSYNLTSKQLTMGNLCIEVSGNGQPGDKLALAACSSSAKQVWRIELQTEDAKLVGVNGLCMDVASNVGLGSPVSVSTCQSATTQDWVLAQVKTR
jgi:hypothetical protein